jgi:hypothetical protein
VTQSSHKLDFGIKVPHSFIVKLLDTLAKLLDSHHTILPSTLPNLTKGTL